MERGKSSTSLGGRNMAQEEILEAKQGRIRRAWKSIGFCVRESNVAALGKVVKAVQLVLAAFEANPNQMLAFGNRKVVALVECVEMAAAVVVNAGTDREVAAPCHSQSVGSGELRRVASRCSDIRQG